MLIYTAAKISITIKLMFSGVNMFIGFIAAVLHSTRMHFMRTTPKIFALTDGRTERFSKSKIDFKIR